MSHESLMSAPGVTGLPEMVQGQVRAQPRRRVGLADQSLHARDVVRMVPRMNLPRTTLLLLAALPVACARPNIDPVNWWRSAEGGRIAEERPAPPNVDAPYPNLASIPPRPSVPDEAAHASFAKGLVADRANAQYAASLAPLPQATEPRPPAPPVARPATEEVAGASLPATDRKVTPPQLVRTGPAQPPLPSVPATPPRKAPTQPVEQSPLPAPAAVVARAETPAAVTTAAPAPAPTTQPLAASVPVAPLPAVPGSAPPPAAAAKPATTAAVPGVTPMGVGTPAAAVASLPVIPPAPPPPPVLADIPKDTAPTLAPVPPPPPPAPVVIAAPGAPVLVPFARGSAALPPQALVALKVLARQQSGRVVQVIGYGEAASADAATQSAALPLAIARARAIAGNLTAAGVPPGAIQMSALAQGFGGSARVGN